MRGIARECAIDGKGRKRVGNGKWEWGFGGMINDGFHSVIYFRGHEEPCAMAGQIERKEPCGVFHRHNTTQIRVDRKRQLSIRITGKQEMKVCIIF